MILSKKPALIIGNGPSVDSLNPEVLNHFHSFGCNHIYKKFNDWKRATDCVLITDSKRIPEIGGAYREYHGELYVGNEHYAEPPKAQIKNILRRDFKPLRQLMRPMLRRVPLADRIYWPQRCLGVVFDKTVCSVDPNIGFNFGHSVTISAIQLAAAMGHTTICMTGVDTSYCKERLYFHGMRDSVSYINAVFTSNPRIYMEPILVMLQVFLEEIGVTLLDCTPNGALRYIKKGALTAQSPGYVRISNQL